MAQRYGGRFSPGADPQAPTSPGTATPTPPTGGRFRNRRASNVSVRAILLFAAPVPLLFGAIAELMSGDALGMVAELGAYAVLTLAAWLTRDGLKAENAFNARKIAKPPVFPRKIAGSILTALGVGAAALLGWDQGLIGSILFGAVAGGAHLATFGLDPMRAKGIEGQNPFDTNRVAEAIERAETILKEIHEAAERFGDRALEGRVDRLAAAARDMFRAVEEDPRDLNRARKFLGVYLMGARDATIKFADLYARSRDAKARADYEALITDLEASFNRHREVLLVDDRSDLDIEIEVLRERLQQEGVAPR
ncbi:MAG: 5-bromo-4-chloroindolyl phosphate hydrolysis family protein [Pseudomonadota bacterium]